MPFLSRVLHPASKRKPPSLRQQGTIQQSSCLSSHLFEQAGSAYSRRSVRKSPTDPQGSIPTFSDLYPVFRSILEKRHDIPHPPADRATSATARRALVSLQRISSRTRSFNSLSDLRQPQQQSLDRWRVASQPSLRHYHLPRRERFSATLPSSQPPLHSPLRITSLSQTAATQRSKCSPHHFIPSRAISHQPGARIFEEIISDPRIPDDYLLINETAPAVERPSSPAVIRDWIKIQLLQAREHFKRQNYMQALAVIEKTREHDYMSLLATFPKNSASAKQAHWHLQDLALVEYCSRLVSAHESQIGNLDMLETVNQLNASILAPIGGVKAATGAQFRTSFQLQQDPLVDYTLAIISRTWAEMSNSQDMNLDYNSAQSMSVEHAALATALLPFFKAMSVRNLFPSSTSLLQDTTALPASESPRRMVFEAFLIAGDVQSAMDWFKLWNHRDRSDWLLCWDNVDFKHWTAKSLGESVWMVDLTRISRQSSRVWLQDFLSALSATQTSGLEPQGLCLNRFFALANMDSAVSPRRSRFYKDFRMGRLDLLESWINGARPLDLPRTHCQNPVEVELWHELALVGVLAKDLMTDDILRSIKGQSFKVGQDLPQGSPPVITRQTQDHYSDSLTQYLESIVSSSNTGSMLTPSLDAENQSQYGKSAMEASHILSQSIQQLMSRKISGSVPDKALLMEYRSFLLDVAQSAAIRLGHLGLFSQVSELKFITSHGGASWDKTVDHVRSRQVATEYAQRSVSVARIDGVRDFVEGQMQSNLAKISAATVISSGLSNAERLGRFSDWFMLLAESSPYTGPMARTLQYQGQLDPCSAAYQQALWTLIKDNEYDLATVLHSYTYGLSLGKESILNLSRKPQNTNLRPTVKELGMLVRALANSDKDPNHLQQAQTIVDQHIEIERSIAASAATTDDEVRSSIDIQILTELAGAWSRKADYARLRHVLETIRLQGLQPNMIFYNTLLKALVDLAPVPREGARTLGSGLHPGTRELGHELMVRQLLRSKGSATRPGSRDEVRPSELQEGWEIFQTLVSDDQDGPPVRSPTLSGQDLDTPSVLKNLILDPRSVHDSTFKPDAFTFSILLAAFARRGQIEPISDLFVEMKQLGIEPDEVICSILANAFAKRGDLRSVDRVMQEARNRRMEPGLPLSNIILDSLVQMNAPVASIRDALDRMMVKSGVVEITDSGLDEVDIPVRKHDFFNSNRFQQLNPEIAAELIPVKAAIGSNGRQRTRGASAPSNSALDTVTMSTLIKYHARQNDLSAAQDLLGAMVQAGLVPGHHVYVMLMAACIRKKDVTSGVSVIRSMRSESGLYADAKAWKGLFRCALDLETSHSRVRKKNSQDRYIRPFWESQHGGRQDKSTGRVSTKQVSMVLQELTVVMEEMRRISKSEKSVSTTGTNAPQEYLRKILTSSWQMQKEEDEPRVRLSKTGRPILNADVKGPNGLLRRLLDHLLWDANKTHFKNAKPIPVVLESPSIPRPKKQGPHGHDEQDQNGYSDVENDEEKKRKSADKVDREQRCEQAIQLVRLVESTGIRLGQRWKWDVVACPIATMTGQNLVLTLKRMQLGGSGNVSSSSSQSPLSPSSSSR